MTCRNYELFFIHLKRLHARTNYSSRKISRIKQYVYKNIWVEIIFSGNLLSGSGSIRQSLVPDYAPIGCYYAYGSNTGFQSSVNFRGGINWADIEAVIRDCAAETRSRGWSYFGVEFYGECFMRNSTLEPTYQLVGADGCAEKCVFGVGAANVLFFYQLI